MSNPTTFKLKLLTVFINTAVAVPLGLVATPVVAQQNIVDDTLIDASSALDNYRVFSPATLTANNAHVLYIDVEAGGSLVMSDSRVEPGSRSSIGLTLSNANAIVQRSLVSSSGRALIANQGARASISDSTLVGGLRGAQINQSTVQLERSQLRGIAANGFGAELFDGTLIARDQSVVSGGRNGVWVRDGSGLTDGKATLVLDNSRVEGLDGSAIRVGRGEGRVAAAQIDVLNGSSLGASNGVLLEVADAASAALRVNDSHLVGDIVVAEGGAANVTLENTATLVGRLENVANLAIDSGAEWTMVDNGQVGDLAMNGGTVRFGSPGEFLTLKLDNLQGNGTFAMEADFANGQADFLEISGQATGDHNLLITASGNEVLGESDLHMVHAASGDARFSLEGGPVDLGAYSYDLVQKGAGNDWYLDLATRAVSPGTQSVMALFNTAPTIWYGELTTLRGRMGEVRRDGAKAGAWVRTYGNQFNVANGSGATYQQTQQGFSFGADTPLAAGDGNWLVGVTAGYSKSDLNLARGSSATVDSYHVGAYTTWFDPQSGWYFDGVARINRFDNDSDVRLSDGKKTEGDYQNLGVGASLEVGRHMRLADGYFIEPFAQVAGLVVQGKDYTLDNGMRAEGGAAHSLQGKVGTLVGRTFELADGGMIQPYARVAAVHEFADDNQVKVNGNRFNNNLAGSRGEVGVGVAAAWTDKWSGHAEFDYSNGEKLEQPWGVNLGVRYNW